MTDYSSEIRHLLYEDDSGEVIGLDEVQLLDPIPTERIAPTRALLRSPDLYLVYQAALVLTAWGDPAGLLQLEAMVDARVDRQKEFAPHRIYGYDNVYDEMAGAVYCYSLSSDTHLEDRLRVFRKLLALYGPCEFESKLKSALLRMDLAAVLVPEMHDALARALELDRVSLASQMLPPLARWEGDAIQPVLDRFSVSQLSSQAMPDPQANVAEARTYLPERSSQRLPEEAAKPVPAGCAHCRAGVYGPVEPLPPLLAVNGDGPEYLRRCGFCGTLWYFEMRSAGPVPESRARQRFPAHFVDWSPSGSKYPLPTILSGTAFPAEDTPTAFQHITAIGELEEALAAARAGSRTIASVVPLLRESLLQVPSSTEPAANGSGMTPLALNRPPVVWILAFTRVELARRFAGDAPYCLRFIGADLLARLPPDYGLSLNFGADLSCQIGPQDLGQLER